MSRPPRSTLEPIPCAVHCPDYTDACALYAERIRFATLTDREKEVIRCLADGLSIKQIAARLRVSRKTVEYHRANIGKKLQLDSGVAIVRSAIRIGFINP